MPSSASKLLTRKKKAVRRGSKTFRHKKNLRQNINAKKQYTKDKKFRRVARGFVDKLRSSIIHAEQSEERERERERERENEIRDTECPVCQEEMTEDEATKLNCSHKFCNKCLITALQTDNLKCPLCRKPIGGEISRRLLTESPQDMLIVAKEVLMEAEAMMEVRVQALRATAKALKEALTVFEAAPASSKMAARAAVLAAAAIAAAEREAVVRAKEAVAEAEEAEAAAEMLERSRAAATRQPEWGRIATRIATRTARAVGTRAARVRSIAARAVGTRAARVRAFWARARARAVGTRAVGTREVAALEEGGSSDEQVVEGR